MNDKYSYYTYESIKEFSLRDCETFDDFIIILHLNDGDKKLRLSITKKHTDLHINPFPRSSTSKIDSFCEKHLISDIGFVFYDKNMQKLGFISGFDLIHFNGLDVSLGESTPTIINPIYILPHNSKIHFIAVPNE